MGVEAKRIILDSIGCALAARDTPAGRAVSGGHTFTGERSYPYGSPSQSERAHEIARRFLRLEEVTDMAALVAEFRADG